jgi:hypothetical protein
VAKLTSGLALPALPSGNGNAGNANLKKCKMTRYLKVGTAKHTVESLENPFLTILWQCWQC